ncbi:hypothetical protein HK102_013882 [Quaeritorhiza haematococci]|nr:hypothetical protein HK102_013882 [Quaeritorhiza haematococci]
MMSAPCHRKLAPILRTLQVHRRRLPSTAWGLGNFTSKTRSYTDTTEAQDDLGQTIDPASRDGEANPQQATYISEFQDSREKHRRGAQEPKQKNDAPAAQTMTRTHFKPLHHETKPYLNSEPKYQSTSTYISPHAVVYGAVEIGPESSIFHNTVIRGDVNRIIIGGKSSVSDNCVLSTTTKHPLKLGDRVTVGAGSVLKGCEVENDVTIGERCVVSEGAKIGAKTILMPGSVLGKDECVGRGSVASGNFQTFGVFDDEAIEKVVTALADQAVRNSRDHKILLEKERLHDLSEGE